jgi:hypothetical protein
MKKLLKPFLIGLLAAGLLTNSIQAAATPCGVKTQQQPRNPAKTDQILNDLKREKLVTDNGGDLSFELSSKKMEVNGKRLPDNIHKRYAAKYLGGNPKKTISYKREVS